MSAPEGVSLSRLGLWAPEGLDCPHGGSHHVDDAMLIVAAASKGGWYVTCEKCQAEILLEPLPTELES